MSRDRRIRTSGLSLPKGARCQAALCPVLLVAVAASASTAIQHASGIHGSTNNLVAGARKVLSAASANEHSGVLLDVVAFAGDVAVDLFPVGETDTTDVPVGRVGLLGVDQLDLDDDA